MERKYPPPGVSQNVAPAARFLNPVAPAARHRRSASGVNHNAFAMTEGSGQSRVAVAPGNDFRFRPDLGGEPQQSLPVLLRDATGQENAGPIDRAGKLLKNLPKPVGGGEAKIGWRQFPLLQNAQIVAVAFGHDPGRLCSASFDPEDPLTRFHAGLPLAGLGEIESSIWTSITTQKQRRGRGIQKV